jgi:hypothetical protein
LALSKATWNDSPSRKAFCFSGKQSKGREPRGHDALIDFVPIARNLPAHQLEMRFTRDSHAA